MGELGAGAEGEQEAEAEAGVEAVPLTYTLSPLGVAWLQRTSLTIPSFVFHTDPCFLTTTFVPSHGTLSDRRTVLEEGCVPYEKGTEIHFNELAWTTNV